MPSRTFSALLSCSLLIFCSTAGAQLVDAKNCAYDRAHLLSLDENQFDQDTSGGWRTLSSRPGCALVAADLLHDYREAHHKDSGLLYWHEAQVRAFAGQYREAIGLMEHSYKPAEADHAGWNAYVDATIAFLRKDRMALEQARLRLAAVPPPAAGADIPPVIDGYMEVKFADGTTRKVHWPPNIDIVEGFQECFDKPYVDAYNEACRQGKQKGCKQNRRVLALGARSVPVHDIARFRTILPDLCTKPHDLIPKPRDRCAISRDLVTISYE